MGGDFVLNHGIAKGRIFIQNTVVVGNINAHGIVAKSMGITGIRANEINITGQLKHELEAGRIFAKRVKMAGLSAQTIIFFGPDKIFTEKAPKDFCAAHDVRLDLSQVPKFGVSNQQAGNWGLSWDEKHPTTSCIDNIPAYGLDVERFLHLGGYFGKSIGLEGARIHGTLYLGGDRTAFGAKSCVWLRDIDTDVIVLEIEDPNENKTLRRAPVHIETFGARYQAIRPSKLFNSLTNHDTIVANALNMLNGQPDMICDDPEGYRPAEPSEINENELTLSYQPHVFDGLAQGYEIIGNVALARAIRIEKNRAYMSSLNFHSPTDLITWLVYMMADFFTGFGYENLRGIYFIFGFIILGTILGWISEDRLRAGLNWIFKRLGLPITFAFLSDQAKDKPLARRGRRAVGELALFSTDRAVLSLALDSDFGTHHGKPIGPILSVYFYFQRIICFGIVILMIAGAFDIFQGCRSRIAGQSHLKSIYQGS